MKAHFDVNSRIGCIIGGSRSTADPQRGAVQLWRTEEINGGRRILAQDSVAERIADPRSACPDRSKGTANVSTSPYTAASVHFTTAFFN